MQYKFSSTTLCDDTNPALGMLGPVGGRLNGSQVNDLAQFIRAGASSFFPRGNRSTEIGFSVRRSFTSNDECSRFIADHWPSLPQQGALVITYDDATTRTLSTAVISDFSCTERTGNTVLVNYAFKGGVFTSDTPPVPDPTGDDLMKRDSVALTTNDESKAIIFGTPFASAPKIVSPTIRCPAGGFVISASVDDSTVSTTGFTAKFSAAIPASGYKLDWFAML